MNSCYINFFTIIALLECIIVVTSFSPKNDNQNNVILNSGVHRPKRQNYKDYSNILWETLIALVCRRFGPSISTSTSTASFTPSFTSKSEPKQCKINVKKLNFKHPLIVDPLDHSKFMYPDDKGDIFFNENDPVFLSCSIRKNSNTKNLEDNPDSLLCPDNDGYKNYFQRIPNVNHRTFFCVCGDKFRDATKIYSFYNELQCNTFPKHDVVDLGDIDKKFNYDDFDYDESDYDESDYDESDYDEFDYDEFGYDDKYRKYAIGFYTDDKEFLKIMEIIYYNQFLVPWYSKSEISKYLAGGQSVANIKSIFDQKYCCKDKNIDMDDVYDQDKQDLTFRTLLYRNTYLRKNTDFVFNRGHLTSKTSMIYRPAARATFAYLNVAPLWEKINSGNWYRIQEHIIEMAKFLKKDLTVYTGVYGGLSLKDTGDGDQLKFIYLHAVKKREIIEKNFPIALYFYKIVFDLEADMGVVFVTVNNPYIDSKKASEYHICDEPIIKQSGIIMPKQWEPENVELGYSYMCYVDDFLQKTQMIPIDRIGLRTARLLYIPDLSGAMIIPNPPTTFTTTTPTTFTTTTPTTFTTTTPTTTPTTFTTKISYKLSDEHRR